MEKAKQNPQHEKYSEYMELLSKASSKGKIPQSEVGKYYTITRELRNGENIKKYTPKVPENIEEAIAKLHRINPETNEERINALLRPLPEYSPRINNGETATMDDFWGIQGWYKALKNSTGRFLKAKWKDDPEVRAEAVKFLVKVLHKDPRDITKEDFHSNRLTGLLNKYYSGSPYAAVSEAYPELGIKQWEMAVKPQGFYKSKENCVNATRWLVEERLQKDPRNITQEDFHSNRLGGLLTNCYNNSPYAAVSEAYPELDIKQWEMIVTPHGFYNYEENRVNATRWLVEEKLLKDPRDVTTEDFRSNRLDGLLRHYYNNSPYAALHEAGLVSEDDREYMTNHGHRSKT